MRPSPLVLKELVLGYNVMHRPDHIVSQPMEASLPEGQLTCLLGANGAGKSTMLRTLAGIQKCLGGKVELYGKPIEEYKAGEVARLVSVVLTDRIPTYSLRAEELVAMGRMPYTGFWGTLSQDDKDRVGEALALVGMSSFKRRRLNSLSDGEMQKLLIAKALAQDAPLMLLDEPICFLDFPSKVEVMSLLARLAREQGRTILVSIHDLELALQTADYLWLLHHDGHLTEGVPRQMASEGELDDLFPSDAIEFNPVTLQYTVKAKTK